jgi:hypothetical protein
MHNNACQGNILDLLEILLTLLILVTKVLQRGCVLAKTSNTILLGLIFGYHFIMPNKLNACYTFDLNL